MSHRRARACVALALVLTVGPAAAADCGAPPTGLTAFTDAAAGEDYLGFEPTLYPGGNERPALHTQVGATLASLAVPRDALGLPDPNGRLGFLTIGMSNTRNESARLLQLAAADPARDPRVVLVNGAQGGMDAEKTSDPASPYWSYVDSRVAAAGLAAPQIQAVWLKQAIARPDTGFPAAAERLRADLRAIVTILKARFPNLNLVYLSSRIYAGYATTALNPEPYAYESAFAVRWLIEEQITAGGASPPLPWLSWAAYLWADGERARADGLTWSCSDFADDGTHPNAAGSDKVARLLLDWLHGDPTAAAWYSGS